MKVLITGGAGFIGSTIASAAEDRGHQPIVLDSFVTGRREFVRGRTAYEGSVSDADLVRRIFAHHPDIHAVVHCAALVVVPDSVCEPMRYYEANVVETLRLLDTLVEVGCRRLLFSSSAAIYEPGGDFSVDEDSAISPQSPYARTKAVVEGMLRDVAAATPLQVISLRYFNPIGADPRLRTGVQVPEPTHALGRLIQLSRQGRPFSITGTDYPTRDGTGIRDYVHVWDLARAHLDAITRFDAALAGERCAAINLGTGRGTTVRELVAAVETVVGQPVEVAIAPRRPGDVAGAFSRSDRAQHLLGWVPRHSLEQGIVDTLAWLARRPQVLRDLSDRRTAEVGPP
ncbi:UDP-glucose 4-epimerase GalE [Nocardioides mangrovi]|uniref:UDP-glucose 4-epimerase n=1 Tax=Nocardioides mangrovi TaxID=2874580 RepID=A0ABS7U7U9_9ACTN|nr:UDP-glucose 4-epimerase GalE [Nocardioides mangrovi]MBZ5736892.1 UDP-glucose 4-epimerase GalE [Nocardioides mangrovi]